MLTVINGGDERTDDRVLLYFDGVGSYRIANLSKIYRRQDEIRARIIKIENVRDVFFQKRREALQKKDNKNFNYYWNIYNRISEKIEALKAQYWELSGQCPKLGINEYKPYFTGPEHANCPDIKKAGHIKGSCPKGRD